MSQSASESKDALEERTAAFDALSTTHQTLVAANATLTADAEIAKGTLMERQLLGNIMDSLIRTLPKEESDIFQLNQLDNKAMSSRDLMNAAGQVLMCCNATMMKSRVTGGGVDRKRAHEGGEEDDGAKSSMTPLQRAIAKEWTM